MFLQEGIYINKKKKNKSNKTKQKRTGFYESITPEGIKALYRK